MSHKSIQIMHNYTCEGEGRVLMPSGKQEGVLDGPSLLCSHHNKGRFRQNLRGNFNEERDISMFQSISPKIAYSWEVRK